MLQMKIMKLGRVLVTFQSYEGRKWQRKSRIHAAHLFSTLTLYCFPLTQWKWIIDRVREVQKLLTDYLLLSLASTHFKTESSQSKRKAIPFFMFHKKRNFYYVPYVFENSVNTRHDLSLFFCFVLLIEPWGYSITELCPQPCLLFETGSC